MKYENDAVGSLTNKMAPDRAVTYTEDIGRIVPEGW